MDQLDDILHQDIDPTETQEWIDSLRAVLEHDGKERAHFLLEQMVDTERHTGSHLPFSLTTGYTNTIAPERESRCPGDPEIEWRIRSLIRWNAMAMVVRTNRKAGSLGGHIASFASSATLYDVGFNHFWRAASATHPGDLIFYQGHSSPGIYARSFLEGRIDADQMDLFRSDVLAPQRSLTSYPHPWLMPDYWQVPTVSMGLGPIQAIYQAQFMRYLENRGLMPACDRKVWCFLGDGEVDEPESLGAIALAGREALDNLIFVVNCNLQRLDGPVRGNGKIIQELEGVFRGAGWHPIKLIWGSYWDRLLERDNQGVLRKLMMETVDGEYQACKAFGGAYTREHFFGKYPQTRALVAGLSDEDIWRLNRGGHDPQKVYAAYHAAVHTKSMPTVILAKTVKGYGMGMGSGEAENPSHQQKKMDAEAVRHFRNRFRIPIPDDKLDEVPYYHPGNTSPEVQYMQERRRALGGFLPARRRLTDEKTSAPGLDTFTPLTKGTGQRKISNTMALVRGMNLLLRDKNLGQRIVPIVADEARTFGMEGMFRQIGIYAPFGQKYRPQDADQLLYYREATDGQVLQQGISEAGGMSSWIAAATSYSISNKPMLPFFIYYSFFGFRRVGDLIWAAGDQRARGFLIGATASASFPGEGLQHSDCASHLMAGTVPNCRSYDPIYAYEVAVLLQHGIKEMMEEQQDIFYYLTTSNENTMQPAMPEGCQEGIIKGMYLLHDAGSDRNGKAKAPRVQLMAAGGAVIEALAAASLLENDFGVKADVWSCPSFSELSRDGFECERWNRLHPHASTPRVPYMTQCLLKHDGPVIALSEYIRGVADQVRAFTPADRSFTVLGADGYGRSDTREHLRDFFEISRYWIAHAALSALAGNGKVDPNKVALALEKYNIRTDKINPLLA